MVSLCFHKMWLFEEFNNVFLLAKLFSTHTLQSQLEQAKVTKLGNIARLCRRVFKCDSNNHIFMWGYLYWYMTYAPDSVKGSKTKKWKKRKTVAQLYPNNQPWCYVWTKHTPLANIAHRTPHSLIFYLPSGCSNHTGQWEDRSRLFGNRFGVRETRQGIAAQK